MQINETKIMVNSLDEMNKLASKIASTSKNGDVIALKGNLGAGKTSFAQAFINSLSTLHQHVTSPTFNIMQLYDLEEGQTVCHCDFYRLKQADEYFDLGLEDIIPNSITLIEWPEIAEEYLPKDIKTIGYELKGKYFDLLEEYNKSNNQLIIEKDA